MKEKEEGLNIDSEDAWRRIKRMKLSVEYGYVCVREDTGFLLWECKTKGFDPNGFDLAAVLEAALINMPSEV